MKRLCLILFVLLLLAAPAMAEEPLQLARMSGPMLGSGGGVVAACGNLGQTTDYGSEHTDMSGDMIFCQRYQAPCSGSLGYGYVHHYGTASDNCKIIVYNDAGSTPGVPDSGDSKIGNTSAISASADQQYKSSEKLGGSITSGNYYWVCVVADPTTGWDIVRTATSANKIYYSIYTNAYTNVPTELASLMEATSRDISLYVEVE